MEVDSATEYEDPVENGVGSENESENESENNPLVENGQVEDEKERDDDGDVEMDDAQESSGRTQKKSAVQTVEEQLEKLLDKTHEYAMQMRKMAKDDSARRRRRSDVDEKSDGVIDNDNVIRRFDPQAPPEFVRKEVENKEGETEVLLMRGYQVEAVNWLIQLHDLDINGILADEMGLGKTLETIAFLTYLKIFRKNKLKHMIIVPLSTSNNWVRELNEWSEKLDVFLFYGNQEERENLKNTRLKKKDWDVLVTSYEVAMIEKAALRKIKKWGYVIIDEAHRVKNRESKLSKDVRLFKAEHRLLLTGTPLQNNMRELWSLLNFLLPDLFDSDEVFSQTFSLSNMENDSDVASKLHHILQPFILRRLKKDVTKDLPPKIEVALYCGLSAMQKQWYRDILERNVSEINARTGGSTRLQNILMQLRKVCNHPYIFPGAEQPNENGEYEEGEHLVENCGKMVVLDKLLNKLKEQDSRVLIFSQMTFLLDILEDYVRMRGYEYCRIDGSTAQHDRDLQMSEYNAPGSSKFVFLLSTRAGGLGINLQTADTVILYDSDWNPHMDLQAQDRAHRIGQTRDVHVYRFITQDTIEERILDRAMKKLYLDAVVVRKGQLTKKNPKLKKDDMKKMIKFGADFILKNPESTITEDDIDAILAAGKRKFDELQSNLREAFDHNIMDFSIDVNKEKKMQEFEGKDYSGYRAIREAESQLLVIDRGPRRRKVTTYSEDAYFRKALAATVPSSEKRTTFRPFKPTKRPPHQFYTGDRLEELERKEYTANETLRVSLFNGRNELKRSIAEKTVQRRAKKIEETARLAKLRRQMGGDAAALIEQSQTPESADEEDEETQWARKKEEIENSIDFLTREEEKELDKLRNQGFGDWKTRDFHQFVRALCDFGKDLNKVQEAMDGKTDEEVKTYWKVFWKKFKTLPDHKKIKKRMDDAEKNRQQTEIYRALLQKKLARVKGNPLDSLSIPYDLEGKRMGVGNFSIEIDRFLLVSMRDYGFDSFEEVKQQLLRSPRFRFDWYIRSRIPRELKTRSMRLLKQLEAEEEWKLEKKKEKEREEKRLKREAAKKKKNGTKSKSKSASTGSKTKKKRTKKRKASDMEGEDPSPPKKRRRINATKEQHLIDTLVPGTLIRYETSRQYHRAEVIAYTGDYEFNIRDVSPNENEPMWCTDMTKLKYRIIGHTESPSPDIPENDDSTKSSSPSKSTASASRATVDVSEESELPPAEIVDVASENETEDVVMEDVSAESRAGSSSSSVLGKRSSVDEASRCRPRKRRRRKRTKTDEEQNQEKEENAE